MTMGEHRRKAREKAGKTMLELSTEAEVHYQTLWRAENDRCAMSVLNAIRLADVLKIPLDEYIGRKVPK